MRYGNYFFALVLTSALGLLSCSGSTDDASSEGGGTVVASGHHPVVVLLFDGVRVDHLGSYGAANGSTPSLDAFAGDAIRFDWAFAPASDAAASMASLLTGLYPTTHGLVESGDRLVDDAGTVSEALAATGLTTAAFLSSGELFEGLGLDQGFEVFETGPQALDGALAWVGQNAGSDFFLVVEVGSVSAAAVNADDAAATYSAQVEALDGAVGRVLEALDAAGLSDKATVAAVSLSGFELGEHGAVGQPSMYSPETHVPMFLKSAQLPKGRSVDKIVEVIDLGPTLMALLGEEPPVDFQGRSLVALINGSGTPPYVAFGEAAGEGEYYAALGGYRLVQRGAEAPSELYELTSDPAEQTDIAANEDNRVTVLEDHLGAWKKMVSAASLDPDRRTEELDDEALEQLKSLGYIQ